MTLDQQTLEAVLSVLARHTGSAVEDYEPEPEVEVEVEPVLDEDPDDPEIETSVEAMTAKMRRPEPVAVPGKKYRQTSANPDDAPQGEGAYYPVEGQLALPVSEDRGFVHPVSGLSFPLQEGDRVLQHRLTPSSFAVLDAEGNKKFVVNKHGKKYRWSPHIPKANYAVIYTADQDSATYSMS